MKSKKCSLDEILSYMNGRFLLHSVTYTYGFACALVLCCYLWHQFKSSEIKTKSDG